MGHPRLLGSPCSAVSGIACNDSAGLGVALSSGFDSSKPPIGTRPLAVCNMSVLCNPHVSIFRSKVHFNRFFGSEIPRGNHENHVDISSISPLVNGSVFYLDCAPLDGQGPLLEHTIRKGSV